MVNAIACTIELCMHLGGLPSTRAAKVAAIALSDSYACIPNSVVHVMAFTICKKNNSFNIKHNTQYSLFVILVL